VATVAQPIGYTEKGPTAELGAQSQPSGGPGGWATFIDDAEYVPELSWPASRDTYHRMRSDSQVEALHVGTVAPVREFRWSIDPNSCSASLAEQAARDFGLPIRGHEDDNIGRSSNSFDFDAFLSDALLSPLYGHFYFEIVGEQRDDGWHMVKLAPRHPRTIQEFQQDNVGDLEAIRQNISGSAGWARLPLPIPVQKLVPFVWRPEAGSHVGRSLLRAMYREWLVKDRTIRVAAINLERGGGVPAVIGPQGASDAQLRDLAQLARQFKVAEGGGGALPFGSKLDLVGGHVPDAISLLKYCDECMARVWALMLVQLGMTSTGNRALGAEFAIYAARAQRALAKWVCVSVNRFLDQYVAWNAPGETHAPLLHFENPKPDSMSVTDLQSLVSVGALTVDPELEAWLRAEHGLPPASIEALAHSRRALTTPPPPGGGGGFADAPSGSLDPSSQADTLASAGDSAPRLQGRPLSASALDLVLPDRPLRRGPTDFEIRAAVNFRKLDQAHSATSTAAEQLYLGTVIPAQIKALTQQIAAMDNPTREDLAGLSAPGEDVEGADQLHPLLTQAARSGAALAISEAAAQGVTGLSAPHDETLKAAVADQAASFTQMAANGISLAAQRKASSLVAEGRGADEIAAGVSEHLSGMKHAWTRDQLQGAVTMAQNVGRGEVFADIADAGGPAADYESSEILDTATCGPCRAIDGKRYTSLAAGMRDYAAGGFVGCDGGPRCRGTLVAVYAEQNPASSSNPVLHHLAAAFNPDEIRGYHGRWGSGGDHHVTAHATPKGKTEIRVDGQPHRTTSANYSHAAQHEAPNGARSVTLHKSQAAADKASVPGSKRVAVTTIVRGDPIYEHGAASYLDGTRVPSLGSLKGLPPEDASVLRVLAARHADTQALHSSKRKNGKRVYTESRQATHAPILDHFLAGAEPVDSPKSMFLAGGSGSGKSTVLDNGQVQRPATFVNANPDLVKDQMAEFKAGKAAKNPKAAALVHEESSDITKALIDDATKHKLNAIIDGVGDSESGKFAGKLDKAHAKGRDVSVTVVTIPVEKALARAKKRSENPKSSSYGRVVPVADIRASHKGVSQRFAEYRDKPWLAWALYSNDIPEGQKAAIIASKAKGGETVVHDKALFTAFLAKGNA